MKRPKTAREKLEIPKKPEIVADPRGQGKMLIPRPLDVDALVRQIPRGKLAIIGQIRERLAKEAKADFTCPLTAGIFLRIAAEAAEEDLAQGKKDITPYWRVIRDDGSLNEKFPGGTAAQAARLREEGHHILAAQGKKPPKVENFAQFLHKL